MKSSIKLVELEKSVDIRKPLLERTNCFRAIHRYEISNLDLTVDIYGEFFSLQNYAASPIQVEEISNFILNSYKCIGGVTKNINKDPHNQGLVTEISVFGQKPAEWFWVVENGMKFKVTLSERQHTGLFLDQRDNRQKILEASKGKSIANLFSYTCAFSVAAALGGAEKIQSVDISKNYLEWGKDNFISNNLDPKKYLFFSDDIWAWIERRRKNIVSGKEAPIDIIICDPPSFSSGTKGAPSFKVDRDWRKLTVELKSILSKKGIALMSNNLQERSDEYFEGILSESFAVKKLPSQIDFQGSFLARYFWCTT